MPSLSWLGGTKSTVVVAQVSFSWVTRQTTGLHGSPCVLISVLEQTILVEATLAQYIENYEDDDGSQVRVESHQVEPLLQQLESALESANDLTTDAEKEVCIWMVLMHACIHLTRKLNDSFVAWCWHVVITNVANYQKHWRLWKPCRSKKMMLLQATVLFSFCKPELSKVCARWVVIRDWMSNNLAGCYDSYRI